jgi:hypothetical protein
VWGIFGPDVTRALCVPADAQPAQPVLTAGKRAVRLLDILRQTIQIQKLGAVRH